MSGRKGSHAWGAGRAGTRPQAWVASALGEGEATEEERPKEWEKAGGTQCPQGGVSRSKDRQHIEDTCQAGALMRQRPCALASLRWEEGELGNHCGQLQRMGQGEGWRGWEQKQSMLRELLLQLFCAWAERGQNKGEKQ